MHYQVLLWNYEVVACLTDSSVWSRHIICTDDVLVMWHLYIRKNKHFLKTFCIIAGSNSCHASIIQLQIVVNPAFLIRPPVVNEWSSDWIHKFHFCFSAFFICLLMLTSNGWRIDVMPPGMIVRSVLELFSSDLTLSERWHRKASCTSILLVRPAPGRRCHTRCNQSLVILSSNHPFSWTCTIIPF